MAQFMLLVKKEKKQIDIQILLLFLKKLSVSGRS